MRYLLDTNVCIAFLGRSVQGVSVRMAREDPSDVAVSAVTISELTYDAHRSRRITDSLRVLEAFRDAVTVLPFESVAAGHAGRVRAPLGATGSAT